MKKEISDCCIIIGQLTEIFFFFFFLTKNCTINLLPYSSDLALCGFYTFWKMHLPIKGKCYVDVEVIQKIFTYFLKDSYTDDFKHKSMYFLII